ncbi:MAG: RNA polymerase sigma-70 factor (ECF subfamily) [Bradymonadia bacterium]
MLRDRDEAEDVMQEVFARLVAQHHRLRGDVPVLHWLYRVTTQLSLTRLRKQKTHPVVADPDAMSRLATGSEDQVVNRRAVLALLERLRSPGREFAVYYFLDRMTMDEIAEMTGTSRKTVSRHLKRVRARAQALFA